ncbi:MAG: hypothetical protein RLZZ595_2006 [Bacteroidota bacterium]|jgi:hypothetical protein
MNRRDALERVALIFGGTIVGGSAFLQGCKSSSTASVAFALTPDQIAFLDELAETIIPTTNTPGAKAAKVGAFMNVMVADCYEEKDQKIFVEGIGMIEASAKNMYTKGFMDLSADQRNSLLNQVNKELKAYNDSKKDGDPNHYFGLMKQLTLLGYFTSEVGATQALRYVAVPGKYEGCIPYAKGDRAWA